MTRVSGGQKLETRPRDYHYTLKCRTQFQVYTLESVSIVERYGVKEEDILPVISSMKYLTLTRNLLYYFPRSGSGRKYGIEGRTVSFIRYYTEI